ncbi:right-handed parallel beta-helix repeat-containing protein [Kribbella shirazensis]|uniref:Parallel beta-helix repeat protein n=1 Tax=Kribbella shirazensis TaxID=1105143 RepID=A0A7X5VG63_9ACTN|nr:right-handed parallel beta-helix repeat-containing protein [Kribbella shirazensis]NIK60613.1 parallel beta-helix repeat protein [Kribbella shirazensis]
MRKLWFAALIAAAVAVVTVAVPVIATENKATTAAKVAESAGSAGTQESELAASRALPSQRPGKAPGTPSAKTTTTQPVKPGTTTTPPAKKLTTPKTPVKPVEPKVPTPPAVESDEAGPAVAGPCSGVVIEPGQDAPAIVSSKPAGTTFCFAAGVHRIGDTIRPKANQVLASAQRAVLTGSVPLTGWVRSGSAWVVRGALPAAYGKSGECEDNKANICHLREQLFLDGTHLTRVASVSAVKAGTFYADYAANAVYLGSSPAGREVEMSRTATAIESGASGVVVRGLTIEHFASAPQAGALVSGPGWTVTANDVRWNHAVGVMLVKANSTKVDKNLIHHNGQLGLGQYSSAAAAITRNVISANNTDGFWIADWESGGIKSTRSSGTVSGNVIKANKGVGMWADVADDGRTITGNQIVGNAADGIRYEISRNGVIEGNTVTGNGFGTGRGSGTSLWDGGGINVNTSSGVTIKGNRVSGNVNGVTIQSRTRGSGPWGTYLLRDVRVNGNTIEMTGGTQSTGMVQNSGAEVPSGEVVFSGNKYVLDDLGTQRFARFGTKLTAAGWRGAGLDTIGSFLAN